MKSSLRWDRRHVTHAFLRRQVDRNGSQLFKQQVSWHLICRLSKCCDLADTTAGLGAQGLGSEAGHLQVALELQCDWVQ